MSSDQFRGLSMSFVTDHLGSRDCAVVRALASHQCVLGSIPGPGPICGWVCCWFSTLLQEVFSGYSGFPLSSKTNISKFQIDPGMHRHFWTSSCELLDALWVNKLLKLLFFLLNQSGYLGAQYQYFTKSNCTVWQQNSTFHCAITSSSNTVHNGAINWGWICHLGWIENKRTNTKRYRYSNITR